MEIGLREWLIIGGILVILLIILDGWRRMKGARNNRLRLDIDKELPDSDAPEDEFNPELPNGGARVSSQPQPLFEHIEPRFDTAIELDDAAEPAVAERKPQPPQAAQSTYQYPPQEPSAVDPERVPLITELAEPETEPEPQSVPIRPAAVETPEPVDPSDAEPLFETPLEPSPAPEQTADWTDQPAAEDADPLRETETAKPDPLLAPLPDQPLPEPRGIGDEQPILADQQRPLSDDPLMDLDKPITELLAQRADAPRQAAPGRTAPGRTAPRAAETAAVEITHSQAELALEPDAEPEAQPVATQPEPSAKVEEPSAKPEKPSAKLEQPPAQPDVEPAPVETSVDFRAEAEQQLDRAAEIELEPPQAVPARQTISPETVSRQAGPREAGPQVAQPPELAESFDPREDTSDARHSLQNARVKGGTLRKEPDPANVLVVSVLARSPEGLNGQALLQLVLACGMRFGDMDIFHRFEDGIDRGAVQFSMANAVGGGTFDIDSMARENTPAVSFFMSMEEPHEVMNAFNCMLATAETVARYLDGELVDENRSVMRSQTQEHYRQRVRDFEMHNMRRRNI
ncbi:cell division protein ZipA [Marinobacterium arenosum]|uniref:cell division protein ZipA n=1 Tax=Marinobacterium arenosum TaxID=2862496 RepID=UPI001C945FAE|nr:cell division protein ZipA [Marinobacterium arenosum]MBY4675983.1 cell division protein ZipA [Marinobacterium arenosum]